MILFAANIIVYWVSADMRPRYLFMLFPLLYIILAKAYSTSLKSPGVLTRIINITLQILAFAGALSLLLYLCWKETSGLHGVWLVIPLLFIISIAAAVLMIKFRKLQMWFLIVIMLAVRISFNAFNLPARYKSYPDASYRAGEIKAGQMIKGTNTYILGDTPFNHDASFYISRESRQIITRTTEISNNQAFYITNEKNLANFADALKEYEIIHTFTIKLNETKLLLIKKPV
jgi:hypothetical protein